MVFGAALPLVDRLQATVGLRLLQSFAGYDVRDRQTQQAGGLFLQ